MKPQRILIVLLCALALIVHGHANVHAEEAQAEARKTPTQYLVELSEYELKQPIPSGLDESEVIDAILSSGVKPVETIRLMAMSDTKSMVQFGKRMTVTTASMTRGDVISRQTKEIEIGTILRLQLQPNDKGAIAEIDYTTSRADGEGTDHSPPDVSTVTMQSTQAYLLGEPRLLATMGAGELTGVVVTVQKIP